ncbi:hypothetical protein GCM10009748_14150 [Agromyces lapidis]
MLWVTGVGAAAAITSAVIAFVQANTAIQGRRDAEAARDESRRARDEAATLAREANAALDRQANAQEMALPPAWSPAISGGGQKVSFQNTSSRHIIVEQVEVEPGEAAGFTRLHGEVPQRIEYGDYLSASVLKGFGSGPERLIVTWRFEGETGTQRTERKV